MDQSDGAGARAGEDAGPRTVEADAGPGPVAGRVLRDLPGVAWMEARLRAMEAGPEDDLARARLEDEIRRLSLRLFGIGEQATEASGGQAAPANSPYDFLYWIPETQKTPEGRERMRRTIDSIWRDFDWDVRDRDGKTLLIVDYLARQMVHTALTPASRRSPCSNVPAE